MEERQVVLQPPAKEINPCCWGKGILSRFAGCPAVVGSNGLEPSTSRLSGVRSNHLSYEPISVAVRCAIRPNHLRLRSVPLRDYRLPFRSDRNATWLGASPWWRRTESNCRPPACKAGALPAELRPRIRFVPLGKSTLLSSLRGPSKLNSAKLTSKTHKYLFRSTWMVEPSIKRFGSP